MSIFSLLRTAGVGAAALAMALAANAGPEVLTGVYQGDLRSGVRGHFYARFIGNESGGTLYWFGDRPDPASSNVMAGSVNTYPGSTSTVVENGQWWSVPKPAPGRVISGSSDASRPNSLLDLLSMTWNDRGVDTVTLRKRNGPDSTGVGSDAFVRMIEPPPRSGVSLRSGARGEGATGTWVGSDGGVYYVRQVGTRLVWFGEVCSTTSATPISGNVFVGTLSGATASGDWIDLPYGSNNNASALTVRVEADRIVATGGPTWWRAATLSAATVSSLHLTLATGGDDMRGGTVVYASVEMSDGRMLARQNVNGGAGWAGGSVQTASLRLPRGTRLADLGALLVEHDGAPRNLGETYDNWNLNGLQVIARLDDGRTVCLASPAGNPFVRLTGTQTGERVPIGLR